MWMKTYTVGDVTQNSIGIIVGNMEVFNSRPRVSNL